MCVYVTHLIFEPPRYPNDQVVYDRLDGTEGCHILARAVVKFDVDGVFVGSGEADGKMGEVLE